MDPHDDEAPKDPRAEKLKQSFGELDFEGKHGIDKLYIYRASYFLKTKYVNVSHLADFFTRA